MEVSTYMSRLRFIRAAQVGGFTLAEIAKFLALDATNERAREAVRGQSNSGN